MSLVSIWAHLAAFDTGWSAAGLATAWTMTKGDHVMPIPGTRNIRYLSQCLEAVQRPLTSTQITEIESLLPIGFARGDRYSDTQDKRPGALLLTQHGLAK